MKFLILTIFSFLTISLYAQNQADLILTQEQNDHWFETLEQLSLQNQIDFLNKRLLTDTNIFIPNRLDRIQGDKLAGRQAGFCKPIIVAGGTAISIGNRTLPNDIIQLTSLLNSSTVKKIEVIKGDEATGLFGSQGVCKGLLITVNKKRTKRKLKKLADKMHPEMVVKEIRWKH